MTISLKSLSFAAAATLVLSVAPAHASVLFSQDFSGGLSAG